MGTETRASETTERQLGHCLLNEPPRALHVLQSLAIENGGTSNSVPALASATTETRRYMNSLLHFCPVGLCISNFGCHLTVMHRPCRSFELMLPTRARAFLSEAVQKADIVQIHGLWTGHSSATLDFASKFWKPAIVSAHGMLDGWALQHKKWKKVPYSALIERRKLSRVTCLRALTRVEAENYRAFGLSSPIAIIPNGISAPDHVSPCEFLRQYPHLEGKKIVLFLGRLHKKKGVDLLAKAWHMVSTRLPDAHLVIAGPDDGPLGQQLRRSIRTSRSASITICGMLTGSLKWSALAAASAFVLPSFSEGLSMAILEALWQKLPVLITRQCNFREIENLECTFLIEPSVSNIAEGLLDMLSRPAGELHARGGIGAEFVQANYRWPIAGEQMADVYDWMLGGPTPSSVEML
jgi:glycosyltransferase involved in cell wall biosynthesis